MPKKFEIHEFDEYNEDGSGIVKVKVSTKLNLAII